jgi:predicted DNA-binding ribbon-helix-helix protein
MPQTSTGGLYPADRLATFVFLIRCLLVLPGSKAHQAVATSSPVMRRHSTFHLLLKAHCFRMKRSIVIDGHKTSISLEDAFWKSLREIAVHKQTTTSELVALIDKDRERGNLSSHIRLFVLEHFRDQAGTARQSERIASSAAQSKMQE